MAVDCNEKLGFCQKKFNLFFYVHVVFFFLFKITQKPKEGLNPNLCVDQFHQLIQQFFSGDPGVEHASYVFHIRLKGPGGGA